MAKIHLLVWGDGEVRWAFSDSLENDRWLIDGTGPAPQAREGSIVAHITFEESEEYENFRGAVVQAIHALHVTEQAGRAGVPGCTVLERFVSEIFKAGMKYGRILALEEAN